MIRVEIFLERIMTYLIDGFWQSTEHCFVKSHSAFNLFVIRDYYIVKYCYFLHIWIKALIIENIQQKLRRYNVKLISSSE